MSCHSNMSPPFFYCLLSLVSCLSLSHTLYLVAYLSPLASCISVSPIYNFTSHFTSFLQIINPTVNIIRERESIMMIGSCFSKEFLKNYLFPYKTSLVYRLPVCSVEYPARCTASPARCTSFSSARCPVSPAGCTIQPLLFKFSSGIILFRNSLRHALRRL